MPKQQRSYAIIGSRGYPSTYGGFETFVRRLAPHLAKRGADVTVYGREARLRPNTEMIDGVRVVHTPGLDRRITSTLSYGLTAVSHATSQQFDAALVLNVANGYWLPLLKRKGVPSVVNVDGIEWERNKWSRLGKAVFMSGARLTARYADNIVVDSRAIGDYWSRRFARSSRFIPYGADVTSARSSERIEALGLSPDSYLLVVARLVPENNVDLFLDALESLDTGVPAVVVGSSVGRSAIEHRLRELQRRRPSLLWLGHVSDQSLLEELWQHCAVYVHGHSVGGTNPALLQALGHGSPTVALGTVYNREVLGDGWPVYRAGEARYLATMLGDLLVDPARRQKLAESGREIIRARYLWSDVLNDYAEALDEAAQQSGSRR
ncbi:DUF1972 domain-containing protein [Blastococcus deserti]|uniref:DUF1972 domain-containing protein n=1 Tax=Blastococcus deserti TaxID=2259033 RepID=A0ABW4XBF8_9ACTN